MNINDTIAQLLNIDAELDKQEIATLGKIGHTVEIPKGKQFIAENESADRFYIILNGRVEITVPSGKDQLTVYKVGAFEMVGWSSLIEPRIYTGNATAVSNTTALSFDADQLLIEMKNNPKLGYILMKKISQFLSQRLLTSMFELLSETEELDALKRQTLAG